MLGAAVTVAEVKADTAPPLTVDTAVIQRVIARYRYGLRECWREARYTQPVAVSVELLLSPSGTVRSAYVTGTDDATFYECLESELGGWLFPPGADATHADFQLVFDAGGHVLTGPRIVDLDG